MNDKQKILVCGDVCGQFSDIFGKINNLNKKSGPFDLFLCCGNFFGNDNAQLEAFKNGSKTVAVPTYVLGPTEEDKTCYFPESEGDEICPNVTYLGKRGVYTTSAGLKLAYLSGAQSKDDKTLSPNTFNSEDCVAIRDACYRGNPDYRGVDILVSSQWPAGVQNLDERKIDLSIKNSSTLVSWLAVHIKPRYHFVASPKSFYERPPYRNISSHHNIRDIVTRFIAVASVGNKLKEKSLYACLLQPISKMRMMDLLQGTTDETDCPYEGSLLAQKFPGTRDRYSGNGQFFYDMDTNDSNKRKRQGDDQRERKKFEFDQEKCWFCLLSPTVEKHLVISVGDHCYIALAKGPLTPFHCLILPIAHHQATTQAPDEVNAEIKKFKKSLLKFYDSLDQLAVFFERNFKTSHLQIQCVPVPKACESQLMEVFQDEGGIQGVRLEIIPSHTDLCQIAAPGIPYFHVQLPSGDQLFTRTKYNFPLHFGRDVLSSSPILDCEEKSDWHSCELDKDEEIKYVEEFRKKYEPFDFTIEDLILTV